jgi:hypothetical protein
LDKRDPWLATSDEPLYGDVNVIGVGEFFCEHDGILYGHRSAEGKGWCHRVSGVPNEDDTTGTPCRWFDPFQDSEVDVPVSGKQIERGPDGWSHVVIEMADSISAPVYVVIGGFGGTELKERVRTVTDKWAEADGKAVVNEAGTPGNDLFGQGRAPEASSAILFDSRSNY